jgi:hypothetical protein
MPMRSIRLVVSVSCAALVGLTSAAAEAACTAPECTRDIASGDFAGCPGHATRRAGDRAKPEAYRTVFSMTRRMEINERVIVTSKLRTNNLHIDKQNTLVKSYIEIVKPSCTGGLQKTIGSAKAGQNNYGVLDLQNSHVYQNTQGCPGDFTFSLRMLTSNQPNVEGAKADYAPCTAVSGNERGVEIMVDRSFLRVRSYSPYSYVQRTGKNAAQGGDGSFQLRQGNNTPADALKDNSEQVTVGPSGKVQFKAYAQVTYCYKDHATCGPGWNLTHGARVRMSIIAQVKRPGGSWEDPFAVAKRSPKISWATHHKMVYLGGTAKKRLGTLPQETLVRAWLEFKNVGQAPLDIDIVGGGNMAAAHAWLLFHSY